MTTQQFNLSDAGIIFTQEGELIDSRPLVSARLTTVFPFLEALWPHLRKLNLQSPNVHIPLVNNPNPTMVGYYDFDFQCVSEHPWKLKLIITIRTDSANRLLAANQYKNDQLLSVDKLTKEGCLK